MCISYKLRGRKLEEEEKWRTINVAEEKNDGERERERDSWRRYAIWFEKKDGDVVFVFVVRILFSLLSFFFSSSILFWGPFVCWTDVPHLIPF